VQANEVLEDHSQVETGAASTFVGVYDGHGGAEASRFISNHLSAHLVRTCPPSRHFISANIFHSFQLYVVLFTN
jgi:pyruvate dehydrogenase phosphatase